MTRPAVAVKVPGKLFVAGEYAVTRPGGLAIVAAVETGFTVKLSESTDGRSHLHTNVGFPDQEFDPERFDGVGQGWEFASKVLKIVEFPRVALSITIESPLGSGSSKVGYGSSAAVTVGMVRALNQFFKLGLSRDEEFEKAAEAHYRVQGSGSLGDVAAICFGGIIAYQSPRLATVVKQAGIFRDYGGWRVERLNFPWPCQVVRTGKSVKTGDKLSIKFSEEFYRESDEIVKKLTTLSNPLDFDQFKRLLLENQRLLIDNLPAGYVTAELDLALKTVNSHPHFVGKISGAGFGENLIVFSHGALQAEQEAIARTLASQNLKMEELKIADYD